MKEKGVNLLGSKKIPPISCRGDFSTPKTKSDITFVLTSLFFSPEADKTDQA